MNYQVKLKVAVLFLLILGALVVQASQLLERPPESERPKPGYFEKQGYSRENSAKKLDPEVRQLLDATLKLYREPGLFINRKHALAVIGASVYERIVSPHKLFPEKKRLEFREDFLKEGIFSRPGWSGVYKFFGQPSRNSNKWYSQIRINVDAENICIDSRAVEGYLDLVLDPGLNRFLPGYVPPERIFRHEVSYARPWVDALYGNTPALIITFGRGCLRELVIAGEFLIGEIDDEKAYD